MSRKRWTVRGLFVGLGLLGISCGGDDVTGDGDPGTSGTGGSSSKVCVPGATQSCYCLGGQDNGVQTCLSTGAGWDACECPDASAGGGGVGGSGGAAGAGGTGGTTCTDSTDCSGDEVCGEDGVCINTGENSGELDDYFREIIAQTEANGEWPDTGGAVDHYLPYKSGINMGISQGTSCANHTGKLEGSIDFTIAGNYESANNIEAAASMAGEVVHVVSNITGLKAGSYGNQVVLRHNDGTYTMYAHLLHGKVFVKVGDSVCRGQALGVIGNTGASSGDHLHYEQRASQTGNLVDPSFYELPSVPAGCSACVTTSHTATNCYVSQNALDCGAVCSQASSSGTITSPNAGALLNGQFTVTGSVEDLDGISEVALQVGTLPGCRFTDPSVQGKQASGFAIQVNPNASTCGLAEGSYDAGLWVKDQCGVSKRVAVLDFTYQPGLCSSPICSPGSKRCNGSHLETCDSAGCAWEFTESCTCGCSNGSCAGQTCAPGGTQCNGSTLEVCLSSGCGWQVSQSCSCGCSNGACDSPLCTAGATQCNGSSLETCASDGCSWQAGQACACGCTNGACSTTICTPGAKQCDGSDVETCQANGCGWQFTQTCSCGCAGGTCTTQLCTPGAKQCDGNDVETCQVDGCGWQFTQACACGCANGVCVTQVCTPGAKRCNGGNAEVCKSDGCGWELSQSCACGCSNGTCTAPTCTAGAKRCNGSDVETCASDGCAWQFTQTCTCGCASGTCATCPPPEVCNGVDDDGNGLIDDDGSCWKAVYRLRDPSTGARCWTLDVVNKPAACSSYVYEVEAFIVRANSVPGTYEARQCSKLTDHIIVPNGSADMSSLQGVGYNCSLSLGYIYNVGAAPASSQVHWTNTCKLWRFRYTAGGTGAHLFTRGADDLTSMTCEPPARGEVFSNFACFTGTPSGC